VHVIFKKFPQIIYTAGRVHAVCEQLIGKQHFTSLGWHLRRGLKHSRVEKMELKHLANVGEFSV